MKKNNESLKRKREYEIEKAKRYKKDIVHLTKELDISNGKYDNDIEYERNRYSSLYQAYGSAWGHGASDPWCIFRDGFGAGFDQLGWHAMLSGRWRP